MKPATYFPITADLICRTLKVDRRSSPLTPRGGSHDTIDTTGENIAGLKLHRRVAERLILVSSEVEKWREKEEHSRWSEQIRKDVRAHWIDEVNEDETIYRHLQISFYQFLKNTQLP